MAWMTGGAREGKPNIMRLHGCGEVLTPASPEFEALASGFPPNPGIRAVVRVSVSGVSTSCGFVAPFMKFGGDRDTLDQWPAAKGPKDLVECWQSKNAQSINGLPTR